MIILVITALLVVGIRETARFNNFIVAVKLVVIALFVVCAAARVQYGELGHAEQSLRARSSRPTPASGFMAGRGSSRGAAVVFFAYIGFDAVSTAAQEAKNPMRDMPIGILGSLVICTVLYVVVSLVLTGIVPFDKLNVPDPIAVGDRCRRRRLAVAVDQARHRLRPDLGHPGDAAGATADFPGDGA